MEKLETQVRKIIGDTIGRKVEYVALRLTWRKLGIDSIDLLDIIVRCEIQFNLKIDDLDAGKLFTPQDIVSLIETKK